MEELNKEELRSVALKVVMIVFAFLLASFICSFERY